MSGRAGPDPSPDPTEAMREAAREVLGDLMRGLVGNATKTPPVNGHAHDAAIADGHANDVPNGDGHANDVPNAEGRANDIPQVPAPPVAAVLRPSTWSAPAAPGEVIGDWPPERPHDRPLDRSPERPPGRPLDRPPEPPWGAPVASLSSDGRVEAVRIDSDDDLQHFVRALVGRLENARDRQAIRTGRLRFALRRSAAAPVAAGAPRPGARPDVRAAPRPDARSDAQAAPRVAKGAVTERTVLAAAADGTRLVLARGAVLTPLARDCARARGVEIERERTC